MPEAVLALLDQELEDLVRHGLRLGHDRHRRSPERPLFKVDHLKARASQNDDRPGSGLTAAISGRTRAWRLMPFMISS
mgnify:CR=1 FL=1